MKRAAIILAILAIAAGSFLLGRSAGVRHAIEDSAIWTEDHEILIELDDQLYAHDLA